MNYQVRISELRYGSTIVEAVSEEEAKKKAEIFVQNGAVDWFDSEITDMTAEEDSDRTYIVTEMCPHCESEIEMRWNTDLIDWAKGALHSKAPFRIL